MTLASMSRANTRLSHDARPATASAAPGWDWGGAACAGAGTDEAGGLAAASHAARGTVWKRAASGRAASVPATAVTFLDQGGNVDKWRRMVTRNAGRAASKRRRKADNMRTGGKIASTHGQGQMRLICRRNGNPRQYVVRGTAGKKISLPPSLPPH